MASTFSSTEAAPPAAPAGDPRWLAQRDMAQEVAFSRVGAGLLLGSGSAARADGQLRLGRNLFTEAEHRQRQRSAQGLLDGAGKDEDGATYLGENAAALTDELATKQAKAAQDLIDSYVTVSSARPPIRELRDSIPDRAPEQALWANQTRADLGKALDGLPAGEGKGLRKRLAELGAGTDPARWFQSASELSDGLLRASAKVGAGPEADALERAKAALDAGLQDATLWGDAAKQESERSAGYARRQGEHIGEFERLFTAPDGDGVRTDPARFRAALSGEDPDAARVLSSTIDSARAAADAAERFGDKRSAARLRKSIAALERTQQQGETIRTARDGVSREAGAADAALAFLAAQGATPAQAEHAGTVAAAREGVFRGLDSLIRADGDETRRSVAALLSPAHAEADDDGLQVAAPEPPRGLTVETFAAHRDHLDQLASDPAYFADVMAASFGNMPESHPELFSALSAQTARTVQYLAAVAPGGTSGGPFAQRVPVSSDELWEYNQRLGAAVDPELVPTELARGALSSQAAEAFEVVHPNRYAKLQRDVWERLYDLHQQGITVPVAAREQLDVLLNIDGGGDPALTWKVAERAYAAQARKAAGASAMDPGQKSKQGAMSSGALSTLNNGASAIAQTG